MKAILLASTGASAGRISPVAFGAAIRTRCEQRVRITRRVGSREVGVTEIGRRGFSDVIGVDV